MKSDFYQLRKFCQNEMKWEGYGLQDGAARIDVGVVRKENSFSYSFLLFPITLYLICLLAGQFLPVKNSLTSAKLGYSSRQFFPEETRFPRVNSIILG